MKFILTVPHARCPFPVEDHPCDAIAPDVGRQLEAYLSTRNFETLLFMGNIPRVEIDLNRDETRQTHWYKTVFQHVDEDAIFIDIHSFDEDKEEWKDQDIVLFEFRGNRSFLTQLMNNFPQTSFHIATSSGNPYNTLVLDALDKGARAVLIEFNERNWGKEGKLAAIIGIALLKLASR